MANTEEGLSMRTITISTVSQRLYIYIYTQTKGNFQDWGHVSDLGESKETQTWQICTHLQTEMPWPIFQLTQDSVEPHPITCALLSSITSSPGSYTCLLITVILCRAQFARCHDLPYHHHCLILQHYSQPSPCHCRHHVISVTVRLSIFRSLGSDPATAAFTISISKVQGNTGSECELLKDSFRTAVSTSMSQLLYCTITWVHVSPTTVLRIEQNSPVSRFPHFLGKSKRTHWNLGTTPKGVLKTSI